MEAKRLVQRTLSGGYEASTMSKKDEVLAKILVIWCEIPEKISFVSLEVSEGERDF